VITEFKNLFEFLGRTEFCPLCDKRLSVAAIFPNTSSSSLTGKRFILYNAINGEKMVDIDLVDNSFTCSTPPPPYINPLTNSIHLQIAQQCRKYHYQHVGSVFLDLSTKKVNLIQMDKIHLHEKVDNSHFAVAVFYSPINVTSIKITNGGSKTKEITFDNVDFDLSSKKKITSKLRTIQLLG
jgi:CRISPR/Cas system endoribonuclease Cas6 (RAMP superfamily)